MTTHVFIVNFKTFRYHLEYLFAGTGAKNHRVDFNNRQRSRLSAKTENLLVSMIADANRIRKGDLIIFYLQQDPSQKIQEGKFYGIFKAKEDWSFLDNNDRSQYLKRYLAKSLTFRTLIESYKVYADGVTEWEALDEIKHIKSPNQLLWSLIYRKLKGNRGNTMITIYESERLCQLIRNKNSKRDLVCDNKSLSFDVNTQKIILNNNNIKHYEGRQEEFNVLPRLIRKYKEGKSFEPHLQAYIVRNIGRGLNPTLDKCVLGNHTIKWIGNEVSCGVGMQRIDILLSVGTKLKEIIPMELKTRNANALDIIQIQKYINWIEQYYIPNNPSCIQPVLLSRKIYKKRKASGDLTKRYQRLLSSFNNFNTTFRRRCNKLKYVEFEISNGDLIFKEQNY